MSSRPTSASTNSEPGAFRELPAAREIAHSFLTARHPKEVYRLALERIAPLIGASFGCVFLRGADEDLLRVVAAHNWPQAFAPYLSDLRVRIGNGPTGRAVAENRMVEVEDVFADESLQDWWEPARELGFASSVSVPLVARQAPVGALTFYFKKPETFHDADRNLLRLVADQLAATAEKAALIEELEHANQLLRQQNVELEAKYREAEEARRLKNELLANVSHELLTPLTAILGYTYLLREGFAGSELSPEQQEAVQKIDTSGNTLMRLINDLLDLANLKLGKTEIEPELCDAVALARAALASAEANGEAVEIQTELPTERIPIHTDPVIVIRILQNLLSNALKFTSKGHVRLRVHTRRRDPDPDQPDAPDRGVDVTWEVEDTGIGIAPEHQDAIFEDFRQVDGSATRRHGGAGVGLALCQGLAHRLGGRISLASEVGQGSTFSLTLPASVVHAGSGSTVPSTSSNNNGVAAAS